MEFKLFECRLLEGNLFKNLIDTLNYKLKKARFIIDKTGLYIIETDSKNFFHHEAIMKTEEFSNFELTDHSQKIIFTLSIVDFAKLLSGIRSNNKLTIKLISRTKDKSLENLYYVVINIMDKNSVIIETNEIMIKIEEEDFIITLISESLYVPFPVNIESTFLKSIKKLKSSKKDINLFIQDSNKGIMMQIPDDTTTRNNILGNYEIGKPANFESKFDPSLIVHISKIASLSKQVSFYHILKENEEDDAPYNSLKISTNIGIHGKFNLYIKDKMQIEYEESIRII